MGQQEAGGCERARRERDWVLRSEKAPGSPVLLRRKDVDGPRKIMGMRMRDSHVYLTEPLNKNAVLTSNAREYILFNHIESKPSQNEICMIEDSYLHSPLWFQFIGLRKNNLSLFTSF